jgi:RHS repeat-associated protein
MCGDTGRHVYIYPVEYLSYGLGKTANVLTLPNAGNPNGNKQYVVADHLGSVRSTVNAPGTVGTRDFMPFGETQAVTGTSTRKTFIDRETDPETDKGNFGVRVYDAVCGRFFSVDALWEKHRALTPYQYALNNPTRLVDPSGLDSAERAKAIAKAKEYLAGHPDKKVDMYTMGAKGAPGQQVDCSGMVSACLKAAGFPDPVTMTKNPYWGNKVGGTGVEHHEQAALTATTLRGVQEGNIVTFRTPSDWPQHIGIITEVYRDESGNVTSFTMIHSAGGTNGPAQSTLGPNQTARYEKMLWNSINGFYKWDTPDVPGNWAAKLGTPTQQP